MDYRLTMDEVEANVFNFMAAGSETTSTALAFATYELARHPDVLQKSRLKSINFHYQLMITTIVR